MLKTNRQVNRKARQLAINKRIKQQNYEWFIMYGTPSTLRESIVYWFVWRVKSANYYVLWDAPSHHPDGAIVELKHAKLSMYIPRFIHGWLLGARGVNRARRELRRKDKAKC